VIPGSLSKPPYAALWKSSIWRIQLVSGFHLGKIWATNLRSPATRSELRLASQPSCVLIEGWGIQPRRAIHPGQTEVARRSGEAAKEGWQAMSPRSQESQRTKARNRKSGCARCGGVVVTTRPDSTDCKR